MDFAEANPHAAIMEGAELLQHERFVHESTRQGVVTQLAPVTDHPLPELAQTAGEDADEGDFTVIEHKPETKE